MQVSVFITFNSACQTNWKYHF